MTEHDIYDRSFSFACRVLRMQVALSRGALARRISLTQLVKAATSVGANLEEARGAQSRADFHAKLRVSLKEAREAHYWLRLFAASGAITSARIQPLIDEANEIIAILTTIAKRTNPRSPSQ